MVETFLFRVKQSFDSDANVAAAVGAAAPVFVMVFAVVSTEAAAEQAAEVAAASVSESKCCLTLNQNVSTSIPEFSCRIYSVTSTSAR